MVHIRNAEYIQSIEESQNSYRTKLVTVESEHITQITYNPEGGLHTELK